MFVGLLSKKKYLRWRRTNGTPAEEDSKLAVHRHLPKLLKNPWRPTTDRAPLGQGRGNTSLGPLTDEQTTAGETEVTCKGSS